jgi:predicted transcriptional regulator
VIMAMADSERGRRERQKRRNQLDIWASILDLLTTRTATLTRIAISSNLNFARAKQELYEMESTGLVQAESEQNKKYQITDSGIAWLKRYTDLAGSKSRKVVSKSPFD